jgi:uncharacterized GH25 family protein
MNMKKTFLLVIAFLVFSSHDMFLKLDSYFLQPNSSASVKLFNGTFDKSENVIARNRMVDVSLVGNGVRTKLDTTQWSEKDSMTILDFETGDEGTYVVGVSTKARNIALDAEAFNSYLEHDGVLDMIEWRKSNNALGQDAVEKYSKHVKTIVQVGNKRTDDWQTVLGYPIEFVPKTNPYELYTGNEIEVQLLSNGKPLANQLVYVDSRASANGHSHDPVTTATGDHEHGSEEAHTHDGSEEHSHEHEHGGSEEHEHSDEATHEHEHGNGSTHEHEEDGHTHANGNQIRTNDEGIVSVHLVSDGIWYLRTINLQLSEEEGLTHESNWATLTFEVGHSHGTPGDDHVHEEETPFGIPTYAYWLGSFALIGILFLWFYRKS